jgi:hypothetical protein
MGQLDFEYGYNDPKNKDYRGRDPPNYASSCMGMMVCPHCGRTIICGDTVTVHEFELPKENEDMIPRSDKQIGDDGNRSSGRKGKRSGLRYLSADMLTNTHQMAEIVDARTQPDNFGKDRPDVVVVKLRFKGEFILWTLRVNNPALEELGNKFGDDESTWKGRQIELYIEEDNFDGKKWIRCEAVTTTQVKGNRAK